MTSSRFRLMNAFFLVRKIVNLRYSMRMAENISSRIVLQDELPIALTVEIFHETQIKGSRISRNMDPRVG